MKQEGASQPEFDGLVRSGAERARDARNATLALSSRFTLAYDASHALALAALRAHGFRCQDRYLVFQCLAHTLGWANEQWRVLDYCHKKRNLVEYEGQLDADERLVDELLVLVEQMLVQVPPLRQQIGAHDVTLNDVTLN